MDPPSFIYMMTERMDDWIPPESWKIITCIMMMHAGHKNKEITVAAQCSLNTVKPIRHELENCMETMRLWQEESSITDDLTVFVMQNSSKICIKKCWKTQASELGLCHVN